MEAPTKKPALRRQPAVSSKALEAPTGIEPVYAVLQTAASPLRHSAIEPF